MQLIGRQETFLQLFPPGPSLGALTNGIFEAVAKSFAEQHMNNPTDAEKRRRFNICVKWAKTLRGDLQWPVSRVADEMSNVLRAELNGKEYAPSTRKVWVPSDGV